MEKTLLIMGIIKSADMMKFEAIISVALVGGTCGDCTAGIVLKYVGVCALHASLYGHGNCSEQRKNMKRLNT